MSLLLCLVHRMDPTQKGQKDLKVKELKQTGRHGLVITCTDSTFQAG